MVDPEFGLLHMQQSLWDPVDPNLLGSLEPALQTTVNGEIYRFGSPRTLRLFKHDPARWCGLLRDPVTGERFYPTERSPHCLWNGAPYIFRSDSSLAVFQHAPDRYQVVRNL